MTPFVGWDLATGEIVVSGSCNAEDVLLQFLEGEVLAGEGANATHWVNAGVLTAYTEPQRADKANRPMALVRWDNTLMAWVAL